MCSVALSYVFEGIFSDAAPIDELSADISDITIGKLLQKNVKSDPEILDKYIGTYRLSVNDITIKKVNAGLVAVISPQQELPWAL